MPTIIRFGFLLLVMTFISCSKKSSGGGGGGGTPPPPVPVTPIISLPQGWKYSATYTGTFPSGLQVFTYDSLFAGRSTKAFCVAFDTRLNRFDFKPVLSATAKTPYQFFQQEPGVTYVSMNGGYFGGNSSYSLVKYNNTVSAPNIKSVNRTYNGTATPYYPTRAAFGLNASGAPLVSWVYNIGTGNDNIYSYPAPSPNVDGQVPQPVPDASFPAGGSPWTAVSAIGGSPVLIRNNTINITDIAELININNTTSRPRSAIGHTANGIVIMVAVEGDNSAAGYPGLNLAELAQLMKDLGCTDAINLDGGGSTSMVIGSRLTVRPGDSGVERPVVSAILIKSR